MNTKYTFSAYPNDVPILEQIVKEQHFVSVSCLIREIVGNFCADKRRDKRLSMPAHHYTTRVVGDFSEVE